MHQLSGEIHAHGLQMAQSSAREVGVLAQDAAQDLWDCASSSDRKSPAGSNQGAGDTCGSDGRRNRPVVWGRALSSTTQASDDATSGRYQAKINGLIAGFNVIDNDNTRTGLGGRYSEGDIGAALGARAEIDGGSVFAYGSRRIGKLSIGAAISSGA